MNVRLNSDRNSKAVVVICAGFMTCPCCSSVQAGCSTWMVHEVMRSQHPHFSMTVQLCLSTLWT